ncbi:MAG: pseudouridine synthase [Sphingomonadales bacterium]
MKDKAATDGERIAKYLARAGIASRREIERMIADGRIAVDGKVLDTPATKVTGTELIAVDGKPVGKQERVRLWRYHKKRGVLTTHNDPQGRPTVFGSLAKMSDSKKPGHVIAVGRLDMNSEGLLLLTNSGELARWLELPSTGWARRYRVRAYGRTDDDKLATLKNGVTVDGVRYGPVEAKFERQQGDNVWVSVALREGKKREVRRVLEHIGLTVNRLIRVSYGPFQLGNLPAGELSEVQPHVIKEQLGAAFKEIDPRAAKARSKPQASAKPTPKPPRKAKPRP